LRILLYSITQDTPDEKAVPPSGRFQDTLEVNIQTQIARMVKEYILYRENAQIVSIGQT
jgi:hypothetical protein